MSHDDIYSFYRLISEYRITIPVIQRAYAEGRKTKQAEDVRKSIVASIIKATAENEPLFFDFVYGNVLPDVKSKPENKFVPFDGQQRLTTLFLFHRYVFERANEPRNILKNFSYKTRTSAKEFIEKLCDNDIIPTDKSDVSDYIKDQKWFYTGWLNDPTISSMLVVLDEIHKQACEQNIDFAKALSHLKDNTITFYFLNMKENSLPAATYVKMNARGKSLTAFENFKASLEEFLKDKEDKEDKNEKLSETFKNNIDRKWLDLFYEQIKPNLPDALIMAFFNRHLLNVWTLEFPKISGDDSPDELYAFNEKIRNDLIPFPQIDTFISWDIYKTILANCPIEKTIRPIFNFLKYACDKDTIIKNIRPYQKWDVFKGKVSNLSESDEPYPFKVAFYALMSYFGQDGYDAKSFSDWMRIVWNIVENQTIDDNDSYLSALRLFDELAENSHKIYEFLSDSNNKITSDFAKEQVEEERLKARKILASTAWEEKILEAERYEILLGKINILFQSGENTTEDEFERRFTLLKSLHKNEDEYHIVKVLVSYYNKQIPSEKINLINTPENLKQLVTKVFSKEFKIIETDTINPAIKYEWIKDLSETNLLNIRGKKGKNLKKYGDRIVLWGTNGCVWSTFGNKVRGNVILGDSKRNAVLKSLGLPNNAFENDAFETDYKDCIFFSGWYTNFKFEDNFFQWWTKENTKQCDIYLMEENREDCKKRGKPLPDKTNTEADEYFAFNVTDEMLKNPELVKAELRKLIKESSE